MAIMIVNSVQTIFKNPLYKIGEGKALVSPMRCSQYLSSFFVLLGLSSRDPFPVRCWLENLFYRLLLMGHGVGSYLGLNKIKSPILIIIFIIINYLFNFTF